eukprot:m.840757 g.840757  ORF g.840757 m.840757 type:complete len:369 (-) comp23469_c0_seq64:3930-5036(-)
MVMPPVGTGMLWIRQRSCVMRGNHAVSAKNSAKFYWMCMYTGNNCVQDAANEEFDVIVFDGDHFNISHSDARKKVDGWTYATGTLSEDGVSFKFAYFRPDTSPGQHGWVADSGYFSSDCDHVVCKDSTWHRKGAPVKPPVVLEAPNATFRNVVINTGETFTLRVVLSVARTHDAALELEGKIAKNVNTFIEAWDNVAEAWERRWAQAFQPDNGYFSGHLPTITLESSIEDNSTRAMPSATEAAGVARVFYMSILSVFCELRTNLPLIYPRAWIDGNGNVGGYGFSGGAAGIGGARSWWWDESMTSLMLALLEPKGRVPTYQAWLNHDVLQGEPFGHGMGNGYAMDCEPVGSGLCALKDALERRYNGRY